MLVRWLFLALFFFSQRSWAGTLTLTTGDVLTGALQGIKADHVLWKSEQLGALQVKKQFVKGLIADEKMKLRGSKVPCAARALRGNKLRFECDNGTRPAFQFLSLVHVIPFEGHKKANHSYDGFVRASGLQQSGNTESKYWEVLVSSTFRHSDFRHVLSLSLDAQKNQATAADGADVVTHMHHYKGLYTLDWFFRPQLFWSNKMSVETDDNRNIQEEYVLGSGLGYQFWETASSALSLELGVDYSRTYLSVNPLASEPEKFTSGRFGTRFRYKFSNGLSLYYNNQLVHSLQPAEPGKATRWKVGSDTGLQCPVGFGISASLSVNTEYVNYAVDLDPNSSKRDTTYRVGVNYTW